MNVAKATEQYINSRPSIRDCIKKKVINYSRLSRQIVRDSGMKLSDFDAVLAASRRCFYGLSKAQSAEDKIRTLLSKSSISIRSKIIVAVIDKRIYTDDLLDMERKVKKSHNPFYAIEGTDAITIITAASFAEDIRKAFKSAIIRFWDEMALVIIGSPSEIEETPGVLSYMASLLSDRGINVVQNMSCWSETLFVVAEQDIAGVLEALKFST